MGPSCSIHPAKLSFSDGLLAPKRSIPPTPTGSSEPLLDSFVPSRILCKLMSNHERPIMIPSVVLQHGDPPGVLSRAPWQEQAGLRGQARSEAPACFGSAYRAGARYI